MKRSPRRTPEEVAAVFPRYVQALVLTCARRYPKLRELRPERVRQYSEGSAREVGIGFDQYCKLAARCPALLYLPPGRIRRRFEDVKRLLRYRESDVKRMIRRRPSILSFSAKTMHRQAVALTRDLGFPAVRLRRMLVRCPQLLTLSLEHLRGRCEEGATALGIAGHEFVDLASRCPQLLILRPARVRAQAEASAAVLGVSYEVYLGAAVRHPSVLTRTPQSRGKVVAAIVRLAAASGHATDMQSILASMPTVLSYSLAHLKARAELQERGLTALRFQRIVTWPRKNTRQALLEHLDQLPEDQARGLRKVWIDEGLISA